MTSIVKKLLAGAPARKTRLHDEKGNLISVSRFVRNGPRAFLTGMARIAFDARPISPWISYDARAVIERLLPGKKISVLEYGSGMSTVWHAQRSGIVVSVEDFKPWFDKVERILKDRGIGNVAYIYEPAPEKYSNAGGFDPTAKFDLIVVDGSHRDQCVLSAVNQVSLSGMIYLDNSDKSVDKTTGDIPRAREILLRFAEETGREITYFTDFAPTQFFVQQGMLIGPMLQ